MWQQKQKQTKSPKSQRDMKEQYILTGGNKMKYAKAKKTSKGTVYTMLYGYGKKVPKGKYGMLRKEGEQIEW